MHRLHVLLDLACDRLPSLVPLKLGKGSLLFHIKIVVEFPALLVEVLCLLALLHVTLDVAMLDGLAAAWAIKLQ